MLFITGFVHGGMIRTSTEEYLGGQSRPEMGCDRFGTRKSIRATWAKHRWELGKLEYEGHIPEANPSFKRYTYLSELSDSMALPLLPKKKAP